MANPRNKKDELYIPIHLDPQYAYKEADAMVDAIQDLFNTNKYLSKNVKNPQKAMKVMAKYFENNYMADLQREPDKRRIGSAGDFKFNFRSDRKKLEEAAQQVGVAFNEVSEDLEMYGKSVTKYVSGLSKGKANPDVFISTFQRATDGLGDWFNSYTRTFNLVKQASLASSKRLQDTARRLAYSDNFSSDFENALYASYQSLGGKIYNNAQEMIESMESVTDSKQVQNKIQNAFITKFKGTNDFSDIFTDMSDIITNSADVTKNVKDYFKSVEETLRIESLKRLTELKAMSPEDARSTIQKARVLIQGEEARLGSNDFHVALTQAAMRANTQYENEQTKELFNALITSSMHVNASDQVIMIPKTASQNKIASTKAALGGMASEFKTSLNRSDYNLEKQIIAKSITDALPKFVADQFKNQTKQSLEQVAYIIRSSIDENGNATVLDENEILARLTAFDKNVLAELVRSIATDEEYYNGQTNIDLNQIFSDFDTMLSGLVTRAADNSETLVADLKRDMSTYQDSQKFLANIERIAAIQMTAIDKQNEIDPDPQRQQERLSRQIETMKILQEQSQLTLDQQEKLKNLVDELSNVLIENGQIKDRSELNDYLDANYQIFANTDLNDPGMLKEILDKYSISIDAFRKIADIIQSGTEAGLFKINPQPFVDDGGYISSSGNGVGLGGIGESDLDKSTNDMTIEQGQTIIDKLIEIIGFVKVLSEKDFNINLNLSGKNAMKLGYDKNNIRKDILPTANELLQNMAQDLLTSGKLRKLNKDRFEYYNTEMWQAFPDVGSNPYNKSSVSETAKFDFIIKYLNIITQAYSELGIAIDEAQQKQLDAVFEAKTKIAEVDTKAIEEHKNDLDKIQASFTQNRVAMDASELDKSTDDMSIAQGDDVIEILQTIRGTIENFTTSYLGNLQTVAASADDQVIQYINQILTNIATIETRLTEIRDVANGIRNNNAPRNNNGDNQNNNGDNQNDNGDNQNRRNNRNQNNNRNNRNQNNNRRGGVDINSFLQTEFDNALNLSSTALDDLLVGTFDAQSFTDALRRIDNDEFRLILSLIQSPDDINRIVTLLASVSGYGSRNRHNLLNGVLSNNDEVLNLLGLTGHNSAAMTELARYLYNNGNANDFLDSAQDVARIAQENYNRALNAQQIEQIRSMLIPILAQNGITIQASDLRIDYDGSNGQASYYTGSGNDRITHSFGFNTENGLQVDFANMTHVNERVTRAIDDLRSAMQEVAGALPDRNNPDDDDLYRQMYRSILDQEGIDEDVNELADAFTNYTSDEIINLSHDLVNQLSELYNELIEIARWAGTDFDERRRDFLEDIPADADNMRYYEDGRGGQRATFDRIVNGQRTAFEKVFRPATEEREAETIVRPVSQVLLDTERHIMEYAQRILDQSRAFEADQYTREFFNNLIQQLPLLFERGIFYNAPTREIDPETHAVEENGRRTVNEEHFLEYMSSLSETQLQEFLAAIKRVTQGIDKEYRKLQQRGVDDQANHDLQNFVNNPAAAEAFLSNGVSESATKRLFKNTNKSFILEWTEQVNGFSRTYVKEMDKATGATKQYVKSTKDALTISEKFQMFVRNKWSNVIGYALSFTSLRQLTNAVKSGVRNISEINSAFIEMQKVSNESKYSLEQYRKEVYRTANAIGSSGSTVLNSTAEWMRLGESLDQAKQSAQDATILYNVSEFSSISEATESLVAMSQAYKDLTKMEIIDKLNAVGNNYSISTSKLAEGLQKSAATLKVAGNDINQTIALLTAGNSILQDPDSVAAGIKVVSMRITGTSAKDLEEIGEDAEGLVTTTSKLRHEIQELTKVNGRGGVDLFNDLGNYRSTYEILLDISKVWNQIAEEDKRTGENRQNAILEKLAGKNRSNVVASILQSGDLLESVYKTSSEDSKGSAKNELEKYLSGIESAQQRLNNSIQGFWDKVLNDETITNVYDTLSGIVDVLGSILEKTGLIKTAVAGIIAIGAKSSFGADLFSIPELWGGNNIFDGFDAKIQRAFDGNKLFHDLKRDVRAGGTDAWVEEMASTYAQKFAGTFSSRSADEIQDVLEEIFRNGEMDREIFEQLGHDIDGVSDAFSTATIKAVAMNTAMQLLRTAITGLFVWGISAIVEGISNVIYKITHAAEIAAEKLRAAKDELNSIDNTIKSLTDKVAELKKQFEQLKFNGGTQKELMALQQQIEYQQSLIKLEEQRRKIAQENAVKEAKHSISENRYTSQSKYRAYGIINGVSNGNDFDYFLEKYYGLNLRETIDTSKVLNNKEVVNTFKMVSSILSLRDQVREGTAKDVNGLYELEKSFYDQIQILNKQMDAIADIDFSGLSKEDRENYTRYREQLQQFINFASDIYSGTGTGEFQYKYNFLNGYKEADLDKIFSDWRSKTGTNNDREAQIWKSLSTKDKLKYLALSDGIVDADMRADRWYDTASQQAQREQDYAKRKQSLQELLTQDGGKSPFAESLETYNSQLSELQGYMQKIADAEQEVQKAAAEGKQSDALEKALSTDEFLKLAEEFGMKGGFGDAEQAAKFISEKIKSLGSNVLETIQDQITEANANGNTELAEALQSMYDMFQSDNVYAQILGAFSEGGDITAEAILALIASYKNGVEDLDDWLENHKLRVQFDLETVNNQIDQIQSAYQSLLSVIQERNDDGKVSIDTLQSALQLEDKYIALLTDETGALSLNEKAIYNMTQARLEDLYVAKLVEIQGNYFNVSAEQMKQNAEAYDAFVKQHKKSTNEYITSVRAQIMASAQAAISSGDVNAIKSSLMALQTMKSMDKMFESIGVGGSSSNGKSPADKAVDKFNAISDAYQKMIDTITQNVSNIQDLADLMESQGKLVGEAFYQEMMDETKKKKGILEKQYIELEKQLNNAVASGAVVKGSAEWQQMYSELQKVRGAIFECDKQIEGFSNSIRDIPWDTFERARKKIDELRDELGSLIDLLDIDEVTSNGFDYTLDAMTNMGLLFQEYESHEYNITKLNEAIAQLDQEYKDGKWSLSEYQEKSNELNNSLYEEAKASQNTQKSLQNLAKKRVDEACKAIDKETEAYKKLIAQKIKDMEADKQASDRNKSVNDIQSQIDEIDRQIAARQGDNRADTLLEIQRLEEEKYKLQKQMQEQFDDWQYEDTKDALNKDADEYSDAQDERKKELEESVKDIKKVFDELLVIVRENSIEIGKNLQQLAVNTGVNISNAVVQPWQDGASAVLGYDATLNTVASSFITSLQNIYIEEQRMQTEAYNTAKTLMEVYSLNQGTLDEISRLLNDQLDTTIQKAITAGNEFNKLNDYKWTVNVDDTELLNLIKELQAAIKTVDEFTKLHQEYNMPDPFSKVRVDKVFSPSALITKHANGGTVHGLDGSLRSIGEDGLIAVQNGEGVLTKLQNMAWRDLVDNMLAVSSTSKQLKDMIFGNDLPDARIGAQYNQTFDAPLVQITCTGDELSQTKLKQISNFIVGEMQNGFKRIKR